MRDAGVKPADIQVAYLGTVGMAVDTPR